MRGFLRFSISLVALSVVPGAMIFGTPLSAQIINACVDARKGTLYIPTGGCKAGDAPIQWNVTGPAGPPGASPEGFVFAGFSAGTTTPGTGLGGMNIICQNSFGPNARMANTKEYFESNTSAAPSPLAWINPFAVVAISDRSFLDYSGTVISSSQTCMTWVSSLPGAGLVLDPDDGLTGVQCDSLIQVACSVPAQAP